MFVEKIIDAVMEQKIYENPSIDDIAVNITLINGDVLPFCFINSEDDECLNIVATDLATGSEKINIISKDSIVKIAVCYADDLCQNETKKEKKEYKDKMII